MNLAMRKFLQQLVPPILKPLARRFVGPATVTFAGDYPSWDSALSQASGYDAAAILERVARGTRRVVRGEAVYERDSVVFDRIEYAWPLLAALLQVAAERGALRVVDFGGSLGSTWRQNRSWLARLPCVVRWRVVEQPGFVALGRSEFTDTTLSFHDTITAAADGGVDVVLFCSSLCYVRDPAPYLREVRDSGAPFVIIDRLPVTRQEQDRITLQTVREPIYPAAYPIRLFSEARLKQDWLRGWRVIAEWECDLQPDPTTRYFGYFLERLP